MDSPSRRSMPRLTNGGVFYRVSGIDKESALREVVELLRLPEEVDRDFLLRVLMAREAIVSTAVGDGIAIPHVRNPVVLHVGRPRWPYAFWRRRSITARWTASRSTRCS